MSVKEFAQELKNGKSVTLESESAKMLISYILDCEGFNIEVYKMKIPVGKVKLIKK